MNNLIRIFGSGEWGLAVARHLLKNNCPIEIFSRDINKIKEAFDLNSKEHSNIFLRNISDIKNAQNNNKNINVYNIIAVSSVGFSDIILKYINYFSQQKSLVWLTKGIDHNSGLLFHQLIDQNLSKKINKCILSGPSFARDLINDKKIEISVVSTNKYLEQSIIEIFSSKNFLLVPTNDIVGVQISNILKNIVAILSGIAITHGRNKTDIMKLIKIAKLDVKSISKDIRDLDKKYNVTEEECLQLLESPACHGDMILSCFNIQSRNYRFGVLIGQGETCEGAIKSIGTVEGYLCTKTLFENKYYNNKLSVVLAAYNILFNNKAADEVLNRIFN